AVRKQFSDQIGQFPDKPGAGKPFSSNPIVRLSDADFEARYVEEGGQGNRTTVQGFHTHNSDQIYVRDRPASFLDPFTRTVAGHEYLHHYSAEDFEGRSFNPARLDAVHRETGKSIREGATQYLTFKTFGPKEFTQRNRGYADYILDLFQRNAASR